MSALWKQHFANISSFAAENEFMQEHLLQSLQLVESRFPDCALIVAGDFNRLDTKPIERHFRLKQIVKIPTRKDAILHRVLTNLHRFYVAPQGFPPFGLSDHNTITVEAKVRDNSRQQSRFVFKRDKRENRKAELGRYLSAIDWTMLFSSANSCQEMLDIFNKVLHTELDLLMPIRRVRVNTSDAPWMNDHLKSLILKRQKAFHDGGWGSMLYKFYRNAVNRERKSCKARFYKTKVEHMKEENPKVWWKEVKRLCGFNSNSGNVSSHIHIEELKILLTRNLQTQSTRPSLSRLKNIVCPNR